MSVSGASRLSCSPDEPLRAVDEGSLSHSAAFDSKAGTKGRNVVVRIQSDRYVSLELRLLVDGPASPDTADVSRCLPSSRCRVGQRQATAT